MSVTQKFYDGCLDIQAWLSDWEDGEWEWGFMFTKEEISELENLGIDDGFLQWLDDNKKFLKTQSPGSSGRWSEILYFDATPENLEQYQKSLPRKNL